MHDGCGEWRVRATPPMSKRGGWTDGELGDAMRYSRGGGAWWIAGWGGATVTRGARSACRMARIAGGRDSAALGFSRRSLRGNASADGGGRRRERQEGNEKVGRLVAVEQGGGRECRGEIGKLVRVWWDSRRSSDDGRIERVTVGAAGTRPIRGSSDAGPVGPRGAGWQPSHWHHGPRRAGRRLAEDPPRKAAG